MFKDARGQAVYNVFPGIPEGQINVSTTYPGVIRAFHRHWYQEDNWFIISGQFEIVLATVEAVEGKFPTIHGDIARTKNVQKVEVKYLGPGESINIPKLVWHGFRILGTEPGTLLYWVTNKFDPNNPDEERAPFDKFYSWTTEYK